MTNNLRQSAKLQTPSPICAAALREKAVYGQPQRLADNLVCVLAENPKDYTGPGTNCYLIGTERLWVVDPGPRSEAHIKAVLAAIDGRPVDGIFVTHTHMDHSPAAQVLSEILGAPTYGMGPIDKALAAQTKEDVDTDFVPDAFIRHGDEFNGGAGRLQAVHTPGHFPNHLCLFMPESGLMFTGDHVMGWSTTAIVPPLGNLQDYMESLDLIESYKANTFLPSHGDVILDPQQRLDDIRAHRQIRHGQILDCLEQGIASAADIVASIYEGLTPRLFEAAEGQVTAHLECIERGVDAALQPCTTAREKLRATA